MINLTMSPDHFKFSDHSEVLDSSAYDIIQAFELEWPCLSFDFSPADSSSITAVAGTQAATGMSNFAMIVKLRNLGGTSEGERSYDAPSITCKKVPLQASTNRVRRIPQFSNVYSLWLSDGKIGIWDFTEQSEGIDGALNTSLSQEYNNSVPLALLECHKVEGYAMDWNRITSGILASGDCDNKIFVCDISSRVTDPKNPLGEFVVFLEHTCSIEDLQWSPSESHVLASSSSDNFVKIWDCRMPSKSALSLRAHKDDVNCISWNTIDTSMLASGCEDGSMKIWDLRKFTCEDYIGQFACHSGPVSSLEWNKHDSSMIASSSIDGVVNIFDLSLERDAEEENLSGLQLSSELTEIPPQLLFSHAAQKDVKEVHWHPIKKGILMSTASDGFLIFKPKNLYIS